MNEQHMPRVEAPDIVTLTRAEYDALTDELARLRRQVDHMMGVIREKGLMPVYKIELDDR